MLAVAVAACITTLAVRPSPKVKVVLVEVVQEEDITLMERLMLLPQ
jgi:hypothetical protein